ncbi:MAG: hypothetical protein AAF417_15050 [Pseudomonadota bacterium]
MNEQTTEAAVAADITDADASARHAAMQQAQQAAQSANAALSNRPLTEAERMREQTKASIASSREGEAALREAAVANRKLVEWHLAPVSEGDFIQTHVRFRGAGPQGVVTGQIAEVLVTRIEDGAFVSHTYVYGDEAQAWRSALGKIT